MRLLRIPEERVSVILGNDREVLKEIKELIEAEIEINSEGKVNIDSENYIEEIRAYNIIKAIGRGFSPERAFRLLEENSNLNVIKVTEYANTDNSKKRLKGRVIGSEGRARNKLENLTDTEIEVYGKTVSILGNTKNVEIASKAVKMLLNGSSHGTAYRYIEKNAKHLK